jgi:hypothetical protein
VIEEKQPVQNPEQKAPADRGLSLLKVERIKEVSFSKSDDTVLFLKEIESDGLSQQLIVQNLSTNATQNITIKYTSELVGNYIRKFEFINENLIYCLQLNFSDEQYDDNEGVYLVRMDIRKDDGKFTTKYNLEDSDSSIAFIGTCTLCRQRQCRQLAELFAEVTRRESTFREQRDCRVDCVRN